MKIAHYMGKIMVEQIGFSITLSGFFINLQNPGVSLYEFVQSRFQNAGSS
jgi:hypothetical protein